jgi:glucuronoarabinoxylan endo-1,4-beta-xylanase
MLGRKVATLADGAFTAGKHTASFNASDLPSGIYVYRLQAGTQTFTRKMILVK